MYVLVAQIGLYRRSITTFSIMVWDLGFHLINDDTAKDLLNTRGPNWLFAFRYYMAKASWLMSVALKEAEKSEERKSCVFCGSPCRKSWRVFNWHTISLHIFSATIIMADNLHFLSSNLCYFILMHIQTVKAQNWGNLK